MMSEAKRDSLVKWIRWSLQLQAWDCHIEYARMGQVDDGRPILGQCTPDPLYRTAEICLDPSLLDDLPAWSAALRHELLHLISADYILVRQQLADVLPARTFRMIDRLLYHASERSVGRIERMLDHGLGLDPAAMVRRARSLCRRETT